MLQVQNIQSMADGERRNPPKQAGLDEVIATAFSVARRQYRIVGLLTLIGLAIGSLYLLLTPRVYTAQTELLFDRGNRPVVSQQPVLVDTPFDASFFESQIKMIESETIAQQVVKKLGLAKIPEFSGGGGGLFATLGGVFRRGGAVSQSELEERAASVLAQKVTAKRIGITFFVEISVQDTNPSRAEKIVNAIAEAYINDQQLSRRVAGRQANEWLEQRLDELRRKADNDEQAVNDYKATHNIVKSGGTSIGEQAVSALNVEIVQARAKASEAAARLDRIEAALRSKGGELAVDATVVDTFNNPIITRLRQEYLSLASKEAEFATHYGPQHLAVVGLRNKMKAIETAMFSELKRFAAIAKSEFEIAKARQENLERELKASVSQSQATDRAQVKLRDLETAQQNSRALYTTFQQRYLEASQQQAEAISDVQIVRPATATNQKRVPKVLAISVFGGLALGLALGFFREAADRVFRTSKQVEEILGYPCVGLIPILPQQAVAHPLPARNEPPGLRNINFRSPLMDAFLREPFSPTAEALRSIKLAADLQVKSSLHDGLKRRGAIIGVCSALASEGKSTLSIALSELAARVGNKVIIVDCDLRHPSTSRRLAPNASVGLAEVLTNECALDMAIWTDPATGMAVLPILPSVNPIDPYQLFSSAAADRLFRELRARYEYIILDLPCMLNVIDVQATANVADMFFLVLEWGRTKIGLIERVLSSSAAISEKIAGVVLNKADMNYIVRYDSYDYKKYYDPEA